jgi:hypothetical protein
MSIKLIQPKIKHIKQDQVDNLLQMIHLFAIIVKTIQFIIH